MHTLVHTSDSHLKEGAAKEGEGRRRADAAKRRAAAPCATEKSIIFAPVYALVAKLVDAPDLGSGGFGRVGSSPIRRTAVHSQKRQQLTPLPRRGNHVSCCLCSYSCLGRRQCVVCVVVKIIRHDNGNNLYNLALYGLSVLASTRKSPGPRFVGKARAGA